MYTCTTGIGRESLPFVDFGPANAHNVIGSVVIVVVIVVVVVCGGS